MTQNPTHKWIVIHDIGRNLTPIGNGLLSPISQPSKFPIETVGQLIQVSRVTRMEEAHPDDKSLRVKLNNENYRLPFETIWAEQFSGTPFPLVPMDTQVDKDIDPIDGHLEVMATIQPTTAEQTHNLVNTQLRDEALTNLEEEKASATDGEKQILDVTPPVGEKTEEVSTDVQGEPVVEEVGSDREQVVEEADRAAQIGNVSQPGERRRKR